LQRKDDSPKPSRPSLLTPAQQEEADRNRILSTLESGGAGKPVIKRRSRSPWAWAVLGVGGLALLAAFGMWFTREAAHDELLASIAESSKDVQPPPQAAVVSAQQAATVPPTGEVSADEVLASAASAATINDEHPAQQASEKQQSLSEMLNAGGQPAPKPTPDVLSKALETPSAGSAPKSPPKSSPKPAPKPKPKPVVKEGKNLPTEPPNSVEQENDIALLSALVAHAQAVEQASAPKKPKLSLKEQLAQCKKFTKSKAAQCRERICEGRSKSNECKGNK
jgi:cytoskeletal protein RodZ